MSKRVWISVAFVGGLFLAWEALARLSIWPSYAFPAASSVFSTIVSVVADGSVFRALASSMVRLATGFGVSVAIGLPLGLLIGRSPLARDTLGLLALGLQTLPSICWLPLSLIWFGLSDRSIVMVVIMGSLLANTLSTADGVRNLPAVYVRAGKVLGSRGLGLYARVILPASLPAAVTGLKLGWTFAWRSLMAGELLYYTVGLGQMLNMGRELNDMSLVLAIMIVIIAIGLAFDRLAFAPAERLLRDRWGTHG